jgi:hypothetical protein
MYTRRYLPSDFWPSVIRGIAVMMTWDGKRYIRGDDVVLWGDSEAGAKYTPEEFVSFNVFHVYYALSSYEQRRYWIKWMVKTEYEANMKRNAITEKDGGEFLKDLDWWFQR